MAVLCVFEPLWSIFFICAKFPSGGTNLTCQSQNGTPVQETMSLTEFKLTASQLDIIEAPLDARIFLDGPAGSGKTTVGVKRLMRLLEAGIPGDEILLLVPQRTLAAPYYDVLQSPQAAPGGSASILTIGGIAKRMVELFWPLVSEQAGFAQPNRPPTFLTLETAQYYMAHLVRPLFSQGLFEGITIERNRLYSQIVDNLNKATLVGFAHTEIGMRLKSAWAGDPGQAHIYEDAQTCANLFREYCLEHNLLDFSLQVELFTQHLWPEALCREYLMNQYRHLIIDNLEEDVPVTFDVLKEWVPAFESALLIFDLGAGYRRFLGADPQTTSRLSEYCDTRVSFLNSFTLSEKLSSLGHALSVAILPEQEAASDLLPGAQFSIPYSPLPETRYYPQMLNWVSDQIEALIEQGTPPGEIVVLAPYLSDSLRFSLVERLDGRGIPAYSHRPSRSLRDEPATQTLLTLAALAHPEWGLLPSAFELTYALIQSIESLDLVRARLLTEIVYRKGKLLPFEQIRPEMQERITYKLGLAYDGLRAWLEAYIQGPSEELDHFLSHIFGELLSQAGYGFHSDYDAAEVAANLIESVRKFRWGVGERLEIEGTPLGKEYLEMVKDGVIAAQYLSPWQTEPEDAVFLAPATTFLMRNRSAAYQFWLDIGSRGWHERIRQPLTHPYVLSRQWDLARPWSDLDELEASRQSLHTLITGLVRRCREAILLGISELGEQGYEHKGQLIKALDRALRSV